MRKFSSLSETHRPANTKLLAPAVVALLALTLTLCKGTAPARATETSPAAVESLPPNGEYSLEQNNNDREADRKDIDKILSDIEEQWNAHNLAKVMDYYSDDYINNDGLDKKAVSALTEDFWKTYPDAKSYSKVKEIRIEGNFATIESRDMAVGSTAKEMREIQSKGDLKSISEGQLYMKKLGSQWRIIGDRIDYEKVRVAFGEAKNLNAIFSAPEQVKSGQHFAAKLELNLPSNLSAVGSITNQPLEYPQPAPDDKWHPVEGPVLERILPANTNNRNELVMATIGITDASRMRLKGIEFLTRRLNVVPNIDEHSDAAVATSTPIKIIENSIHEENIGKDQTDQGKSNSSSKDSSDSDAAGKSTSGSDATGKPTSGSDAAEKSTSGSDTGSVHGHVLQKHTDADGKSTSGSDAAGKSTSGTDKTDTSEPAKGSGDHKPDTNSDKDQDK